MISNERREVAERLRELPSTADADWCCTAWDILFALGVKAGDVIGFVPADNAMRLADLIDPTCHIVLKPSDSDFSDEPHYFCSKCGKEGIDVYERNDYTLAGIVDHANYCSYCGARVVDADD